MQRQLDLLVMRFTYRYELLLGASLLGMFLWPMYSGFQGWVASFVVLLLVLIARSASQFKRQSEDDNQMDKLLGSIPFRYEALVLVALILWIAWGLVAGATGFMLGLGIFMLALGARSASQLKRGEAVVVHALE